MSNIDQSKVQYPLKLIKCKNSADFKLFRDTINTHHSYVKYKDSPTRRLSFLVYETVSGNFIGSIGLTSATLALKCRDSYIGWKNEQKMLMLNRMENNSRFCLVKNNITISNAASMALKLLRTEGKETWKEKYGDELILLETFVLPERTEEYNNSTKRNGACYLADNWIEIGLTEGHSIKKIPMLLWKKENTARGKLARENAEQCMLEYSKYVNNSKEYGYTISQSDKKIVFIRPLIKNWKKVLLSEN
jgi:hypothetical protein